MLRVVLIIIALASGAVAAWLVGNMSMNGTRNGTSPTSEEVRITEVLVAATDVAPGMPLRIEQLRWQTWPAETVQESFILRSERPDAPEEIAGSVVRGHLVAGAPIITENIAPAQTSFLSAVLSPGMRAVAIRVSAEKTAGGFILPNDRVDVLLAVPCRPADVCETGMTVRTILRDVRVLAIDQSGSDSASENVLLGKTATLELSPEQAETIVAAEASGALSLVLRSAADRGRAPDQPRETPRTVRVIRGGESEYVTIR